ncbi:MAG: family 78 glycoside hydrolase catalytic domain [Bacillota bacterium]|nr:family 78 glycoside hydrolase catalytic domain [Bacillota bacterium]
MNIYDISVNYIKSPVGIKSGTPRFGWKLDSYATQEYYEIRLCSDKGENYTTGKIKSRLSDNIVCDGFTPTFRTLYTVRITVWTEGKDTATGLSSFETALPPDGWKAQWIKPKFPLRRWAMYFKRDFIADKTVKKAKMYTSGLGYCEIYLNNQKINNSCLEMPITNYEIEIPYRTYDVTNFIQKENAVGMLVGDGFYAQNIAWNNLFEAYGVVNIINYSENVCMIIQLEIEYTDGDILYVCSNDTWKALKSPITLNNIYGGENYDARLESPGWCLFGSKLPWEETEIDSNVPAGTLTPCIMPPVRVLREINPINMSCLQDAALFVYDMGENFAGVVEINIPACPAGTEIVMRFAETIDESGNLDMRSTGAFATNVIQQDRYITAGKKEGEIWSARFTYHTFRYVEISGLYKYDADITKLPVKITGLALGTDLEQTGNFECSYDLLNRLQTVSLRTFLSNYHSYPEDCPGREKCGWTGDAQLLSDTLIMNYDMAASYEKYLNDILSMYELRGFIPMITPGRRPAPGVPLWGIASVIMPYNLYRYYGNIQILEKSYDMMKAWEKNLESHCENYLSDWGFGDWIPPIGNDNIRRVPTSHTATLAHIETLTLLIKIADILGRADDISGYIQLKNAIIRAFNDKYYNPHTHDYGYQATDAAAYMLDICPDGQEVIRSAVNLIQNEDKYEMTTGIYGNKMLIPSLFENSYGDIALKLLFDKNHFNFRSMLEDNATSIWEDLSMCHIGMPKDKHVSSYNHPMHGSFMYFVYSCIAGIQPLEPAFRKFKVSPKNTELITSYRAEFESPYGKIVSERKNKDYFIEVPSNTVCLFELNVPAKISGALLQQNENRIYSVWLNPGKYEINS